MINFSSIKTLKGIFELNTRQSLLRNLTNLMFAIFAMILTMHEAGYFVEGQRIETILLSAVCGIFYILFQDKSEIQIKEIKSELADLKEVLAMMYSISPKEDKDDLN